MGFGAKKIPPIGFELRENYTNGRAYGIFLMSVSTNQSASFSLKDYTFYHYYYYYYYLCCVACVIFLWFYIIILLLLLLLLIFYVGLIVDDKEENNVTLICVYQFFVFLSFLSFPLPFFLPTPLFP